MKENKLNLYFSIFLLSFTGLSAKLVPLSAIPITFSRAGIAAICLGLFALLSRVPLRLNRQHILPVIGIGALLGLHWMTYMHALKISTVAIGMISLYSFPVFTALFEPLLLKEPFRKGDLLAAVAVFIGIVIMNPVLSLESNILQGCLWGIGSAFLYSLRNVFSRYYLRTYAGETIMVYQLAIASAICIPLLLVTSNTELSQLNSHGWIHLLIFALPLTALAHTLWVKNMSHFKAAFVGTVSCLAPVFGAIWAIPVLGEALNSRTIIGGTIILCISAYEAQRHATSRQRVQK
ncbi:MAG: DMT family transporter [bacterium]|nr:DMT family transporter [bacterium]